MSTIRITCICQFKKGAKHNRATEKKYINKTRVTDVTNTHFKMKKDRKGLYAINIRYRQNIMLNYG